jgi:hypothetical protein
MKTVNVGVGAVAIVTALALSGAAFAGACKTGMAWGYQNKSLNSVGAAETGAISVGCYYHNAQNTNCDPVNGESKCSKALPILCAYRDPAYPSTFPVPAGVDITNSFYYGWAGEVVATTAPVRPCIDLNGTLSGANAYCKAEFGPNWSVAEFHDSAVSGGGGWDWQAYGGVMDPQAKHFWVDITTSQTAHAGIEISRNYFIS